MKKKLAAATLLVISILGAAFYVGTLDPQYGRFEGYGLRVMDFAPTSTQGSSASFEEKQAESPQERMVVYNAQVSLESKDIQGVLAKIRTLAERYGGYVAGSFQKESRAQITIRVPQDKFQATIHEIGSYGRLLDERTTSEDVTERYVDLKARLENLKNQEQRLREVLGMARTVEEILKIEKEIERVRGQIESLQGQVNYFERNVAMSLITVSLTEPVPPFTPPGMNWNEVLESALRGLFLMLRGMIILMVSLLPLIAVGAPVYLLYRRKWKGRVTSKPS